jgi:hypothetical protein
VGRGRPAQLDRPLERHRVVDVGQGAGWAQSVLSTSLPAQFLSIANAPGTTTYWAVGATLLSRGEQRPRIEERC